MKRPSLVYSQPDDRLACRRYRTAVSVHSHTFHSRESLAFIPRVAGKIPLLSAAMRWQQSFYGSQPDMSRAWWTPPLSPMDAWRVESAQISLLLSMEPLVSLTDHDNIEAINLLSVVDGSHRDPISIEWTVPFRESFFHLGVHNLPAAQASEIVAAMHCYTQLPSEPALRETLAWLEESSETLIVLNHPYWDEKGIGAERHAELLREFLQCYRASLHALELNGLRPWKENEAVGALARSLGLPVISGGDRHGREPNAIVNLTNANCFSEFVEEVRRDRWSLPLFLPQYEESHAWRVTQTICDVLREEKGHGLGWTRWSDRIFYRCDDGVVRSLTTLWGDRPPLLVRHFVGLAHFAGDSRMRDALRFALVRKQEALP